MVKKCTFFLVDIQNDCTFALRNKQKAKEMNTPVLNTTSPTAERYWLELKGLSNDVKLELIMLLSGSLMSPAAAKAKSETAWADRFCGSWKDRRSTDEIVDDIRSMRSENHFDVEL